MHITTPKIQNNHGYYSKIPHEMQIETGLGVNGTLNHFTITDDKNVWRKQTIT